MISFLVQQATNPWIVALILLVAFLVVYGVFWFRWWNRPQDIIKYLDPHTHEVQFAEYRSPREVYSIEKSGHV
jgi:hypothetical protein